MIHRIKSHDEVIRELQDLKNLVQTDPETAKIVARVALIRTGVLNEDGSSKDQIVDYPHSLTYESDMPRRRIRK